MALTPDQIIDYTARTEGGKPKPRHDGRSGPDAPYDAWNPDDTGAGVSFGCIQFNQASGRLAGNPGSPLAAMFATSRKMFPAKWDAIMGPWATKLIDPVWIKTADLNNPDIKSRILATARDPDFKRAQREQARLGYFVPAQQIATEYGVKSDKGLAMLFDACVQMGPSRVKKLMASSKGSLHGLGAASTTSPELALLTEFASQADSYAKSDRRTKMLNDPNLPFVVAAAAGGTLILLAAVGIGWWMYTRT